jgi:hypothetical protein
MRDASYDGFLSLCNFGVRAGVGSGRCCGIAEMLQSSHILSVSWSGLLVFGGTGVACGVDGLGYEGFIGMVSNDEAAR